MIHYIKRVAFALLCIHSPSRLALFDPATAPEPKTWLERRERAVMLEAYWQLYPYGTPAMWSRGVAEGIEGSEKK